MSYDLTLAAARAAETLRAYARDARRCVDDGALDEGYVIRLADKLAALAADLERAAAPARPLSALVERTRRPTALGTDRLHKERE